MSYATVTDAQEMYGEDYVLTSVSRVEGAADTDALTKALAKASSLIDSYLGARYDVPIAPVPDLIVGYCIDIAIYQCSSDAGSLTEEKRVRRDDAVAWLKDVAKGVATLGLPDLPDSDFPLPELSSSLRVFTRGRMSGL